MCVPCIVDECSQSCSSFLFRQKIIQERDDSFIFRNSSHTNYSLQICLVLKIPVMFVNNQPVLNLVVGKQLRWNAS